MIDPALQTLLLPLENGAVVIGEADRLLFMRARMGPPLADLSTDQVTCEQSFAPDRNALERASFRVEPDTDGEAFDIVLLLPGRQRQEARAQLARAMSKTRPGGVVVAAAPNTEGAKTLEADVAALFGSAEKHSKNKCRVVWADVNSGAVDQDLLRDWLVLDAPRPVLDGSYVSRPGVFAWNRIDPASRLLADHLPDTLAGRGADLGAGFGFLSREVLSKAPKVIGMDLYEAEKRALDLARENLSAFSATKALNGLWTDVTRGIEGPYDFVVSNPPFHQAGRAERKDVGQSFIRVAAAGLRSGGTFWMVANRHLPYEQTLTDVFQVFEMIADEGGYKVIKAIKGKNR